MLSDTPITVSTVQEPLGEAMVAPVRPGVCRRRDDHTVE
jgi:hypothetical protein